VSSRKNTVGVATGVPTLTLDIVLAQTFASSVAIESALDEFIKALPTSAAAWQVRAAFPMERVLPGFRMSVQLRGRGSASRRVAVTVFLSAALAAGIWLQRAAVLRGVADLWIVSDPVTQSDVVAVLGGGLEVRPFAAAEIYERGLATRVLVSEVLEARSTAIVGAPGHTELNRMVLLKLGVPEAAIATFGQASRNTWDEANALRNWATEHHVARIIIPTEIFSARRVRWVFHRTFAGSSVQLEIPSFEGNNYSRAEWWKSEAGMIAFQNEVMKYLYYRLRY
jgi:uncharacterized SAM-binding protein YcdF (DUF218 family)